MFGQTLGGGVSFSKSWVSGELLSVRSDCLGREAQAVATMLANQRVTALARDCRFGLTFAVEIRPTFAMEVTPMNWRLVVGLCALLVMLMVIPAGLAAQEAPKTLTIWLIPQELASKDKTMDFDAFNREVEVGGWVKVLNTTVSYYRSQLTAWNPEFAYPNFPIIKGQRRTLDVLRRFAEQNNVTINVRFVWWGQAFDELRAVTEGRQNAKQDNVRITPDVAQIGSTWVGYFARSQALIPRGAVDGLSWRDAPDAVAASLRYTTDVRLIFYWKRMSWPVKGEPFKLESDSYKILLNSLAERPIEPDRLNPPMAMPVGLTQNILHDYAPLVWAGGGRFIGLNSTRADLTSEEALAIPRLLMESARKVGEQSSHHRLLAFPEMSHEETVQHFLGGEYLAVIEPTNFIKRWLDVIKNWSKTGVPEIFTGNKEPVLAKVNFWDYAGVAVPPRSFVGGSDLIVTNQVKQQPQEKGLSFSLARFLATDKEFSTMLAELGTLPAQRQQLGEDVLRASLLSETEGSGAQEWGTEFTVALRVALARREENEYPALAEWPEYVESREVLEAIQRVWRRIGEGGDTEDLKAAAAEAQHAINRNLDLTTRLFEDARHWYWLIIVGLMTLIIVLSAREIRNSHYREKAFDEVRKVRGFASAALQSVYEVHSIIDNPYRHLDEQGRGKSEKALVLIYGLQGWRRGRDERSWTDADLSKIAWSAFILALESKHTARLFKKWEQHGYPDAQQFLREERLIRSHPDARSDSACFYLQTYGLEDVPVPMPFMLEQALVCLLQNAIEASREPSGRFRPITVAYEKATHSISVLNEGASLYAKNNALASALNECRSLDEFEARIDTILLSDGNATKPGVGLVEAYCIANQCYGGVLVDRESAKISIRLTHNQKEKSWKSSLLTIISSITKSWRRPFHRIP